MRLIKTSSLSLMVLCSALLADGAYNVTTKSIDAAPVKVSPLKASEVTSKGFRKVTDKQYVAAPTPEKRFVKNLSATRGATVLPLPINLQPTEAEADLFTILDGDGNGETFSYGQHPYGDWGLLSPRKDDGVPADDWAWMPGAELSQTGKLYTFKCEVATCGPIYPMVYEILLCSDTDPNSVVKTLVEPTTVEALPWQPPLVESKFTVDEPGVYYVAVHHISDDSQECVWMNFSLEADPLSLNSPGEVTGLSATAAPLGELSCDVTFALPTIDYSGNPLPADAQLNVTVNAPAESVTLQGIPGQELSCTLAAIQGYNEISVTTGMDDLLGMTANVKVFCGIDIPATASNILRTTDASNCVLKLTWEPPVEGVHDGYVPPMGHTYSIMQLIGAEMYTIAELGEDVFSADVAVDTYGSLGAITIGVCVDNNYVTFDNVVVGPPYSMPIKETLSTGHITYQPIQRVYYLGNDYQGSWWYGKPNWGEPDWMVDGPNCYRIVSLNYPNVPTKARLTLPKFTTIGQTECSIDMEIFTGGYEQVEFLAWTDGMTAPESLLVIRDGDYPRGYRTITIELPESMLDKGWVEIMVEPTMLNEDQCFLMGDYMIHNSVVCDLGVANISGLDVVHAGKNVDYMVTIGNFGYQDTVVRNGVFSVESADGEVLYTEPLDGMQMAIEPGMMLAHAFNVNIAENYPDEVLVKFEFEGSDDNLANNMMSKSIRVYNTGSTFVSDLKATFDEENPSQVELKWTAPVVASGLETFEYDEPFNPNVDTLGEFANVDNDGSMIVCFGSFLPYPGAFEPAGFQTFSVKEFSNYDYNVEISYPVYNGDKYAYALIPTAYMNEEGEIVPAVAADDWLISPEVKGGTDVIFHAKGFNYGYGAEPFEILYSTTSANIADFVVLESKELFDLASLPQWQQIEVTLPEDARYFAIHYIGENTFGLCIDDIYYTPADREDIVGYDVYRNNEKIADCADVKTAFTDEAVAPNTTYTYYVIPVAEDGTRGITSNSVEIYTGTTGVDSVWAGGSVFAGKGFVKISGYPGESATVISTSGAVMAEVKDCGSATVQLPAGVYMVKHGQRTEKVIVK